MSHIPSTLRPEFAVAPLLETLNIAPKVRRRVPRAPREKRLGQVLLEMGAITPGTLTKALVLQDREQARLGEILRANGWITEETLLRALSIRHGIGLADLAHRPQDPALVRLLPRQVALDLCAVPWTRLGGVLVIATPYPEHRDRLRAALPPATAETVICALAPRAVVEGVIEQTYREELARAAESLTPHLQSCRAWKTGAVVLGVLMTLVCLGALLWPMAVLKAATVLALVTLAANTALKGAVLKSHLMQPKNPFLSRRQAPRLAQLPKVTLMLPLFKEPRIAGPLVQRMARLDYPAELLDILLVVEEHDTETLHALKAAKLPPSFRVISVPDGHPRTKPRAMNYALNFARGEIVGIYDAEDAPAANQIHSVVRRFAQLPEDVVCLQGRLDFYNPRQNWISRCFAIEYATWFRVFLPGLRRLGMLMPLGGTTLFFRRAQLRELGGWDAHNVTEDADLGVRLARAGYRTEIIDITTDEEANAAAWPWVKQRSRWIKGYLLTWAVHNRNPIQLYRELGPRMWLGFQLLFVGTLLSPLMAPVLWLFGLGVLGTWHPIASTLSGPMAWGIGALVTLGTVLTLSLSYVACMSSDHLKFLRAWVPLNMVYVGLATAATLKALSETLLNPFYWDKTEHGHFGGDAHGLEQTAPLDLVDGLRPLGPVLPDARSPKLRFRKLSNDDLLNSLGLEGDGTKGFAGPKAQAAAGSTLRPLAGGDNFRPMRARPASAAAPDWASIFDSPNAGELTDGGLLKQA